MSTQEITLEQIDKMKADCKQRIEKADALNRLLKNPDFNMVFVEGYTRDYPARVVGLLGDSSLNLSGNKVSEREEIQESLIGVARFQTYIRTIFQLANQAVNELEGIEDAETEFHKTYDVTAQ